jgi:hypothetical protein
MKTIDRPNNTVELERRQQIEQARKDIKKAFYVGLFMSGWNLVIFLVVITQPAVSQKMGLDGWLFIDVAIICSCTYGIFRNNNFAATAMLGYYIINIVIKIFSGTLSPVGIPLSVYFMYCFYKGVIGTSTIALSSQAGAIDGEFSTMSDAEGTVDRYSSSIYHAGSGAETPTSAAAQKPATRFSIDDRLIELCSGDRAQSEWLLHQVIRKNPDRTMEWCNQTAIEQLENRSS